MDKWLEIEFESSTVTTPEFAKFAREFKKAIMKSLPPELSLARYSRGHFYVSGFIQNTVTDRIVYFSISDVRYFPGKWNDEILIRTARSTKDYTGGPNNYCTLGQFGERVLGLTKGAG